ncbi:MAG: hypothetical protein KGJ86_00075 [Chloroflexota bacterium]|nr:hypothetical protein [Chloroflexota bacterium]
MPEAETPVTAASLDQMEALRRDTRELAKAAREIYQRLPDDLKSAGSGVLCGSLLGLDILMDADAAEIVLPPELRHNFLVLVLQLAAVGKDVLQALGYRTEAH